MENRHMCMLLMYRAYLRIVTNCTTVCSIVTETLTNKSKLVELRKETECRGA